MDTYWADSTGRRNSGFIMLDKEPFEDFNRRLLAKRFAFGIQGMGYCAQIPGCVPAEVGALGEVLSQQTIGVFVRKGRAEVNVRGGF
jgi:hypothetical protein